MKHRTQMSSFAPSCSASSKSPTGRDARQKWQRRRSGAAVFVLAAIVGILCACACAARSAQEIAHSSSDFTRVLTSSVMTASSSRAFCALRSRSATESPSDGPTARKSLTRSSCKWFRKYNAHPPNSRPSGLTSPIRSGSVIPRMRWTGQATSERIGVTARTDGKISRLDRSKSASKRDPSFPVSLHNIDDLRRLRSVRLVV